MAYRYCPSITYMQIPCIGQTNSSSDQSGLYSDHWYGYHYSQAFAWLFYINETYSTEYSTSSGDTTWSGRATKSDWFGGVVYRDDYNGDNSSYPGRWNEASCNTPSGFEGSWIYDTSNTSQWFMTPKSYKLVITNDNYIHYGSVMSANGLTELYLPNTFYSIGKVGLYLCTNLKKLGTFDRNSREYQNLNDGEFRFGITISFI